MTRSPLAPLWPLAALLLLAPPALSAPTKYAGVDVGSTGARAVVVQFDPLDPGSKVEVLLKEDTLTSVGEFKGGMMNSNRIAETAKDLERFVGDFVTKFGVDRQNIHLVGSSSVAKATNRGDLVAAVRAATKLEMKFLETGEEEARLTAAGLTVLAGRSGGLLVDIGGGNAKGGINAPGGPVEFSVPFGTRSLTTRAREVEKEKKLSFREAVAAVRDAELVPLVRKEVGGKPALAGQPAATLTGGVAYAAATLLYPDKVRATTVELTLADFRKLIDLLGKDELAFPAVDTATIADEAVRKKAAADIADVREKFPAENLLSGATVALALGAELQLEGKRLTFVRDAHFAWIVGYLSPRVPARKDPPPPSPLPKVNTPEKPPVPAKPLPPLPEPLRPRPGPVPLGVPYYPTPTGGYIPVGPGRPVGYFAPYPVPSTTGRYTWDHPGYFAGPGAYRFPAYPTPGLPR